MLKIETYLSPGRGWNSRRRGVALLLVLVAAVVAFTISSAYLSSQSTSISIARNMENLHKARCVAESGLRAAIAYVQATATWRDDQTHGTWAADVAYANGTYTVVGEDGADTDGDGVITQPGEGDGDLGDDTSDLLTLTVTGKVGGATHIVRTVVSPGSAAGDVLLVVPDASSLTDQDSAKQALMQSWGYTVTTISATESQTALEGAADLVDVVYISEEVSSGNVNTKLKDVSIGVVSEENALADDFGVGQTAEWYFGYSAINITDNSHYITSPFSTGSLTITSATTELTSRYNTLAGGLAVLAERTSSSRSTLDALEVGGALYGGGTASGRRVFLPWGGASFDIALLTDDGKTLMKRALEWAAVTAPTPTSVLHYNFDEQSGSTVTDRDGSVDLSFAAGNGTLTWVNDVDGGTGLFFDQDDQSGTAIVKTANDNVADSLKSALQASDALTVQVFLKAIDFDSSYGRMVSYSRDTGSSTRNFTLAADNDGSSSADLIGRVKRSSSASEYKEDNEFSTDTLHVLTFVADLTQSSDNIKLFVDGQIVRTSSGSGNFDSWTSEQFMLGNEKTLDRPFRGTLYDVRIWDSALSDATVLSEANKLLPATDETPQLIALYEFNEVIPNPALAAHWPLDEASGTDALDDTGGNGGTYTNGAAPNATGMVGTAAAFDGNNDYIEIPHSADYLLDNGTIAFWFKTDSASSTQGLFSKDSSGYDTGGHVHIHTESSRVKVRLQSTSSSYTVQSGTISNNTWYHVVFIFGAGGMKLYLNGSEADTDSYSGGLGTSSGGTGNQEPIALGANTWNSGNQVVTPLSNYFSGTIDDVRIYDWSLDATQVTNLHAGNPIGASSGPGTIVEDTSGYGAALDLTIADPGNVTWIGGGGLQVDSGTTVMSAGAATKLYDALTATGEFTLEVKFQPANLTQDGPARIVSYSSGTSNANFTFGQVDDEYVQRLRTSNAGGTGSQFDSAGVLTTGDVHHVIVTYQDDELKFYRDGALEHTFSRDGTFSNWNSGWRFVLANETTDNRDWLGTLYRVAVYDRGLSASQTADVFGGGSPSDESGEEAVFTARWVRVP
jgi:hypothetical protein